MEENRDLVWDLDQFSERERAHEFVMGFENRLCVYSYSVNQLYTNYNIFVPREENRKIVILPNPYAHHDTFNNVPEAAVFPTGLHIVPGKGPGQPLLLSIPFRSGKTRHRLVPLQAGIRLVNQQRPLEKPFLPVLMKGDLREMDATTPCLHLNAINLDKVPDLSSLDKAGVQRVIMARLAELR